MSTIIVTLIIILISLVAVGILWVVVGNILKNNSEQVSLGKLTVNTQIQNVNIYNNSNNVSLSVKRNSGAGTMSGIKFVFTNGTSTEVSTQNLSMNELDTRIFNFHLTLNVSTLTKISIIPIFTTSDGKESLGNLVNTYNVGSGGGGGSSGGSSPTVNSVCGNNITESGEICDGVSLNNQNCTTQGFSTGTLRCNVNCLSYNATNCSNSICVPQTCSSLGYVCGSGYANGTCGRTFSCGGNNCPGGQSCVGGSCFVNAPSNNDNWTCSGITCYYLDAVSGNDNIGTGSVSNPYRTIAHVKPLLHNGDTVVLNDGNYDGIYYNSYNNDFHFTSWVTYRANHGAHPTVDYINLVAIVGTDSGNPLNYCHGTSDAYLAIRGLHISGNNIPNGGINSVSLSGVRHVIVDNCSIEMNPANTILRAPSMAPAGNC